MKPTWIYLEDEAPTIGAGWRPVIARIGYKWVHIKTPGALRGTRIKRKLWDEIIDKSPLSRDQNEHQKEGLAHH